MNIDIIYDSDFDFFPAKNITIPRDHTWPGLFSYMKQEKNIISANRERAGKRASFSHINSSYLFQLVKIITALEIEPR